MGWMLRCSWGLGWGGMWTFMLRWWCYAAHGGWGGVGCERSCYADDVTLLMGVGVGWDVNVHVTLMMLRCSWGLGWGGMLKFMLRWWCYGACGVWGGVGWDVNVHVTLMMLRCSWGLGWGGMWTFMLRWWCYAAHGGWGGVGCERSCYADDVTLLMGVGVGWDVNVHVTLMMLRCSWGLGWGGMWTFMLRWWCYAAHGGWGGVGCERSCYADDVTLLMGVGVGWDVNVHVTLMMLRCSWGLGWGGMWTFMLRWWCYAAHGGWGGVGCERSCYADDVTLLMGGWGGVGCESSCYADDVTLLMGGGVGWDVNVHVTLMMLRCSWGVGWGGMWTFMLRWWCYAAHGGWGGVGCERSCYADDVTLLMGVGVGWDVNVHVTLMMLRCSWGVGWGGMWTFMLRWWCYAAHGGWGGVGCERSCYADDVTLLMGGGVGWDVNVHVTLMMLRCSWGLGWGGMWTFMLRWWCYAAHGGWGGVGCERSCYADDVTLLMGVGVGWDVKVHVTLMMLRCLWGLGWGGMWTFMLRWWCYAAHGGWGGSDVNVHVTLMMLRCSWGLGWGGMWTFMLRWWCYAAHGGWGGVGC